jgi:hypothetical protein
MTPAEANIWLRKIVRQRKRLIRTGDTKINLTKCTNITNELSLLLQANPYNGIKIFRLIYRKSELIRYIIPGNDALDKNLKILNECIREAINQNAITHVSV